MTNEEILNELKEIRQMMHENIVGAWNESLSDTTDAVIMTDMTADKYGEVMQCEYNYWYERLSQLMDKLKN